MSINLKPNIRTDLVQEKNDVVVTTSLQIAEVFDKRHDNLIAKIENLINNDEKFSLKVRASFYNDSYNRKKKMYLLDKDAFVFVVQKFTGKKAYEWQWKYIEAFNQMETIVIQRHSSEWQMTREKGKMTRRRETDQIALFIDYATKQGSKSAGKYYMNFTKLLNNSVGIKTGQRDVLSPEMLGTVMTLENQIMHKVKEGMDKNLFYKDIYKNVKVKIETLTEILTLPEQKYLPTYSVKNLLK